MVMTKEDHDLQTIDKDEEDKIKKDEQKRITENMEDFWKHQSCGAEGGW